MRDKLLILFVDDDDDIRELGHTVMESEGHTVQLASNANEALFALTDDPAIELLLTDIEMPGAMNGWQLAQEVKKSCAPIFACFTSLVTSGKSRSASAASDTGLC
jgi:CheY-like chemotaxis protein